MTTYEIVKRFNYGNGLSQITVLKRGIECYSDADKWRKVYQKDEHSRYGQIEIRENNLQ
jgi:hypothetical protein